MATPLTMDIVRTLIPELAANDAALTLHISIVESQLDVCLDDGYATEDIKTAIKAYVVAHFARKGAGTATGAVVKKKWADGDEITYSDGSSDDSSYWDLALQLDHAGCLKSAFIAAEEDVTAPISRFVTTGKRCR